MVDKTEALRAETHKADTGMLKFLLYSLRWQLSTPILYPIVRHFGNGIVWVALANFIGAGIFFWVDKFIFTSYAVELWQFKDGGRCDNCGKEESLWRLAFAPNYDKRGAPPKFLCMACSKEKTDELRAKGYKIRGRSR